MEEPVLYNRKPPFISAEDKNETICVQFISWNWLTIGALRSFSFTKTFSACTATYNKQIAHASTDIVSVCEKKWKLK